MKRDGACILCGGALAKSRSPEGYRWEGRVFAYQTCGECRARIIQPLPSDEELARIYRHDEYHETYYEECAANDWPPSLAPSGKSARLLDFGCGDGAFLAEAANRGFDALGVELDSAAREVAQRNSGCPVFPLEELMAGGRRFDVIHLGDVLEHVPAPLETLRRLEPLLSNVGLFFIEGPLEENASLVGFSNRIFTQLKRAVGRQLLAPSPPFHLSRTSAANQRRFFEHTMGYELKLFEITETGWPYYLPNSSGGGAKARLRTLIGKAAVSIARLANPFGFHLGNRFVAIAAPTKQRSEIGVDSPAG